MTNLRTIPSLLALVSFLFASACGSSSGGGGAGAEQGGAPTESLTGSLTITLPDATTPQMPVECAGVTAGEKLDVHGVTSADDAAPDRIEVRVTGKHTNTGPFEILQVAVSLGPKGAFEFDGNSLQAQVKLQDDGSGQISNVSISNSAFGSPKFAFGQFINFSMEWTC